MLSDVILTIIDTLEEEIIKAITAENKENNNKEKNPDYITQGTLKPDQIQWVCRLFSKYEFSKPSDIKNFSDQVNMHFFDKSKNSFTGLKHLNRFFKLNWNISRFNQFKDKLSSSKKDQLINALNQIEGVNIKTIDDIPPLIQRLYQKIIDTKALRDKNRKENRRNSYSEPIVPSVEEKNTISQEKAKTSNLLIATIIMLVLVIIFLIIFFVAKNNPNPHVDDKILPNDNITTSLTSSATTVSIEIKTISLTSSTSSNDQTTTASSEAVTISTLLPTTVKSNGNGNKADTPVIVVTVNVDNGSHNNTETHTESTQNNTHQDPPVTQAPVTHTPITTYIQVQRTDPTLPDISIGSIKANKGQSDVCVEVVFSDLTLRGDYDRININFNAAYDNDLIFKEYTVSQENTEVNELNVSNGNISFNMSCDCCENDITVSLFFDVPDSALDGDYVVYMPYEASHISLLKNTYNFFYDEYVLSTFHKYDSLYRYGVIHVS